MRSIKNPKISLTLAYATNPTTIDSPTQNLNGYIESLFITVPTLDASTTATLNIKDANGNVLFTKAALAAGANQNIAITTPVPIAGPVFEIVTSGNQTANRVFAIMPYVDNLVQ